jgi:hypothetical protein
LAIFRFKRKLVEKSLTQFRTIGFRNVAREQKELEIALGDRLFIDDDQHAIWRAIFRRRRFRFGLCKRECTGEHEAGNHGEAHRLIPVGKKFGTRSANYRLRAIQMQHHPAERTFARVEAATVTYCFSIDGREGRK